MNAVALQSQLSKNTFLCDALVFTAHTDFEVLFPEVPTARRRKRRVSRQARHVRGRAWRRLQGRLPFSMPVKVVTPLMRKILHVVTRTATAKLPMPTNAELGEILGHGRQSVAKAFDRLVALGRVRVDVRTSYRRVYVVSKQIITGWGEHRPGHAPFSKHRRGELVLDLAPRRLGRADGFSFLGIPSAEELSYRVAITGQKQEIAPARVCQFILSDATAYWPRFCGLDTIVGKSWCEGHYRGVFAPRGNTSR